MATPRQMALIQEIQKKYGAKIDLASNPALLLEIIRNYRNRLDDDDDGGGGGGGVGGGVDTTIAVGIDAGVGGGGGVGGVSTIAVGIDSGKFRHVDNEALLREILNLKKQLKDMQDKLGGGKTLGR